MSLTVRSVHTHGKFSENAGVTCPTVHRVQPTPVPAVPTDVAIEAFRRAVRGAREVS